jgi:hypothetical protein
VHCGLAQRVAVVVNVHVHLKNAKAFLEMGAGNLHFR